MAKRTEKPAKRREQPWMAAAREKLRAKHSAPPRAFQEAMEMFGGPSPEATTDASEEAPPQATPDGDSFEPSMVRVYVDPAARTADTPAAAAVVVDALLEMAAADLAALGKNASKDDIHQVIDLAMFAYNWSIHEAIPASQGGDMLRRLGRAPLEMLFKVNRTAKARFDRMAKIRAARFGHLMQSIMMCAPHKDESGRLYISIMLGTERPAPST